MSQYFVMVPADEALKPMFQLRLHQSLVSGLFGAVGISDSGVIDAEDADQLERWADHVCDNPTGQRAAIARMIANAIRAGNGLEVKPEPATAVGTFWDAVSA